ncbi:hypothetical protein Tco_0343107 [Tanacetum coccineum]
MTDSCDKAILSGAAIRPYVGKDMYDSWKSRMELYMMNRQHGRMILEAVEYWSLIWPTIEENGVTRPRDTLQLNLRMQIQADCCCQAPNIISKLTQRSMHLLAIIESPKETWGKIQLLCKESIDDQDKRV